jgi:phage terminase large subunit
MPTVQIPFAPRPLQREVAIGMRTHRFGALVCHRRFGKTVLGVNLLQQGALMCAQPRPRFAYLGPTYRQAKATAFDYMQFYARPIPGVLFNQSELRVDYPPSGGNGGGQVRIYGADNPDALRGIYLDGVVLDEYGLMDAAIFSEVLRPALSDRGGWALFMGTPNGKNQFWELIYGSGEWVGAKADPAWFFGEYKASETGILPQAELDNARSMMTADEYQQEMECSFEASVKGAIYSAEMAQAEADGRICSVPYDPILPVDTDWDLGIGDAMSIWFSQSLKSGEVRLIDYYEMSGEGFPHYASVLKSKGYTYGTHWAPHDIQVRELGSGRSRLEVAFSLGIRFRTFPRLHTDGNEVEDGIHAVRMLLPKCWFDARKCKVGLEALRNYRRAFNQVLKEFIARPVHDKYSHAADAFRGFAVRQQAPTKPRVSQWAEQSTHWAG